MGASERRRRPALVGPYLGSCSRRVDRLRTDGRSEVLLKGFKRLLEIVWDRSPEWSQFRSAGRQRHEQMYRVRRSSAHTPAPLGTLRKARSQVGPGIWRGKAWYGRAGQAFALVDSGVVDRATANSPLRTVTGHKQDDQTAKTKPPAGSCSRILDQSLGPTRARSSRNRPLE